MGMTVTEKILARAAGVSHTRPGEILDVKLDAVATMDLQGKLVLSTFKQLGLERPWDPDRVVIVFDHEGPPNSIQHAEILRDIRQMARDFGIKHLYDIGRGILHQLLPEQGHVLPGEVAVATESHTPTSGAVGAVVVGVGQTDAAVAMATGKLWLMVPETIRIDLHGSLRPGVSAKDIALEMMRHLKYEEEAVYRAVEIGGPGLASIHMDGRFTLTNFCSDMGCKSAIIEADEVTVAWVQQRANRTYNVDRSDPDCTYALRISIDLSTLEPLAACPHRLDNVKPIREVAGQVIHQAVLGSCTNGRVDDFRVAAEILRGNKIHPNVRFIAWPASETIYREALALGYIETLLDAGATMLPPGCGCCYGVHSGILSAGEVCISSTNRNMKGRMGSDESQVFLASPETVAASAVAGVITDPRLVRSR